MSKERFCFFDWHMQQSQSKLTGCFGCHKPAVQQKRCLEQRFCSILHGETLNCSGLVELLHVPPGMQQWVQHPLPTLPLPSVAVSVQSMSIPCWAQGYQQSQVEGVCKLQSALQCASPSELGLVSQTSPLCPPVNTAKRRDPLWSPGCSC